jgi:hypothetical protein
MSDPIFHMRAGSKYSGTQKPNWSLRLGLSEEQLSTGALNQPLKSAVSIQPAIESSWDSALVDHLWIH